jgi:hypothetical protein
VIIALVGATSMASAQTLESPFQPKRPTDIEVWAVACKESMNHRAYDNNCDEGPDGVFRTAGEQFHKYDAQSHDKG